MDVTNVASVVVAFIAALAAFASQRAAANASIKNTAATTASDLQKSRTEIEKDAYDRAERYLTGTITRQDGEIESLRREIDSLRLEVSGLRTDVASRDQQIRVLSAALADRGEL